MASLVRPHGGPQGGTSLRPLMPEGEALAAARERAGRLPAVPVSSREAGDVVMLGIGGFTPLEGFMGEADWRGVCDEMRTANGLFWPIPITLSVDADTAGGIETGSEIALLAPDASAPMAILAVTEKYAIDKVHECRAGLPYHGRRAPRREDGDGAGRGEPRRPPHGALRRELPRGVRRAVPDPGRDPGAVRSERLEHRRRIPDPQPDAPVARISGQDRDRDLRRGARPLAAGQPQAR